VVSGIVGFPGSLFDDESFGIAPAASSLGIDIILSIIAPWKTSFSVLEVTSPDVARQRYPTSLLELFEQVVSFLRGCCERGGLLGLARQAFTYSGVGIQRAVQRSVAEAGSDDGGRRRQAEREQ
jgi:hypothetical protein